MAVALDQFLRSLRECRLISPEEATSLGKALQSSKAPHTVEAVAKILVKGGKLTEFQAAALCQGQTQSLNLGEYVLLDILGKGGMGIVYRARHRLMDRVVAVKTLPTGKIKPDAIQRFYREVKAAARLSHPNIVTAYDAGEHAGTHYLVMEYVVGRDLAVIVKEKGPLPLPQAIDHARQAARGLEYAHKHGVVHRDVKPSNLLLDQEGVVKILDMGLALLSEELVGGPEAMDITGAGQILGTVDYMSPEQAEDVHSANHLSDIYSLGCTLFYLLTRRSVFSGENVVKRILAHRDKPIPTLTEFRPDCPEALDQLVRRMLAKRPEDRPQGMGEIIADLENCLVNPAAVAPPVAAAESRPAAIGQSWLEDLVSEQPTPATDNFQVQEATLESAEDSDVHSAPPKSGAGVSSLRHSKIGQPKIGQSRIGQSKIMRGGGVKKAEPAAPDGNRWKIIAAATAAALLAVAGMAAWIVRPQGGKSTARTEPASASSKPAALPPHAEPTPASGSRAAWEDAWSAAKVRADRLLAQHSFANAIGEYTALAKHFDEAAVQERCKEAISRIETEGDAAYRDVENVARQHLDRKEYARGRAVLQTALTTYGHIPGSDKASKLIHEIDEAQRQEHADKPVEVAQPAVPATAPTIAPAVSPELRKQRQLDAEFTEAMRPVEGRVLAWDFQAAMQALGRVRFNAPELKARLALRRGQIERMADLKARMIEKINQADPHLTKADLALTGSNGEVEKADADAITTTLPTGKQELLGWTELKPRTLKKMLSLVVRRENSGDLLAAGLMSLPRPDVQSAAPDVQAAEQYFDDAQALGANTDSYRALLAARDFAAARNLLAKQHYAESDKLLSTVEEKYGKLPWFTENKPEWDNAVRETKRGLREKEAQGVYSQAATSYGEEDWYELKPLVARLKSEFADSAVLTDPQRKPSLADLERAVADLGPLVRVRKGGAGDAKTTIQAAIDAAVPNTVIQIEEAGPWTEVLVVPADKENLTIRGKKGLLPLLTTAGAEKSYAENFVVHAPQLALERLKIVRDDAGGAARPAISAEHTALTIRGTIVHGLVHVARLDARQGIFTVPIHVPGGIEAKDSAFFGSLGGGAACALQNVLATAGVNCGSDSHLRHCTIKGHLQMSGTSGSVSDSIVASISADDEALTIDYCDVFGDTPYSSKAKEGKRCIAAKPLFLDVKDRDFTLLPASPCRKAASDGSDMGFAAKPDLQGLLHSAADLIARARGKP